MGDKTRAELKEQIEGLLAEFATLDREYTKLLGTKKELELGLSHQQRVVRVMADKLLDAQCRTLALKVVHGDLAPDQFETHRRAAQIGVDNLLSALAKAQDSSQPIQAS